MTMKHPDLAPARFAIFDMDGLLLNTEIIYTEVTQKIVSRYNKVFDWQLKANMIGRPAIDSANYLVNALDLSITAEEYLAERNDLLFEASKNCDAMPGAENLIRTLKQHHIPIALATSSYQKLYEAKITRHQHWFSLFDYIITGDDPRIDNGKPAPDIFNIAAQGIQAQAEQTLVFEDAPSGLQAGLSANMRVIVVPDPNMDKAKYQGATLILEKLTDFDPALFNMTA